MAFRQCSFDTKEPNACQEYVHTTAYKVFHPLVILLATDDVVCRLLVKWNEWDLLKLKPSDEMYLLYCLCTFESPLSFSVVSYLTSTPTEHQHPLNSHFCFQALNYTDCCANNNIVVLFTYVGCKKEILNIVRDFGYNFKAGWNKNCSLRWII